MVATDKFVFVHLPRTGGTFLTTLIQRFFPSARQIGHHLPRQFVPETYSHLPLLGTVRNPWDFYVSLYHYVWPRDEKTILASWMTDNGKLGFEASVRNLLNLGVDNERLDRLIDMLPERLDYSKRNVPGVAKDAMRKIRGSGLGYYTVRFNQMFGTAEDVFFCRLETLSQDLLTFFERSGSATDALREFLLSADKVNTADHLHYSRYYPPELADLVLSRDRLLIDRFGYKFEQSILQQTYQAPPATAPKY
jgi:hypothetical protein